MGKIVLLLFVLSILSPEYLMGSSSPKSCWQSNIVFTIEKASTKEFKLVVRNDETKTWLDSNAVTDYWMQISESKYAPASKFLSEKNGKAFSGAEHYKTMEKGEDLFLSDTKLHFFLFPGKSKTGDTYRMRWVQTYTDPGLVPMVFIPNEDSVSEFTLTINHPLNVTVTPHIYYARDSFPYSKETVNEKQVIYRFGAHSHLPDLPRFPFNDRLAQIVIEIRVADTVLTANTPEALADWFSRLAPLIPSTDSLAAFPSRDSIANLPDIDSKLRALHDWTRTNIRYLQDYRSLHGYQPHSPASVFQNGYGDCKDRAYLICAVAKSLGIPVFLGVVSTTQPPPLEVIHPQMYNHVICYYEDSLHSRFFDATARYHPFEDYPSAIVEQQAIILDPEHPRTVTIPRNDSLPELSITLDGHIDSLTTVVASLTLRGDILATYRATMAEQLRLTTNELMNKIILQMLPRIEFHKYEVVDTQSREITIRASADISRWVIASNAKRYLPHTFFVIAKSEILDRQKDTLPMYYDSFIHTKAQITLRGIHNCAADSIVYGEPNSGYFASQLIPKDSASATYSFQVMRRQKMLTHDAKESHLHFCQQYFNEKKNMFVLSGGKE